MAKGYRYTCKSCGAEYEYCPKCAIRTPSYDAQSYCSKTHADIFAILSKHGCHLATAEETLEALQGYNTAYLSENIQAHIDSLLPKKAKVKREVERNESTQE